MLHRSADLGEGTIATGCGRRRLRRSRLRLGLHECALHLPPRVVRRCLGATRWLSVLAAPRLGLRHWKAAGQGWQQH